MKAPQRTIAVLGAGITGLCATLRLREMGYQVVLLETSHRVGGAVGSTHTNGFLAEWGPNTLLEASPRITQLITSLGLDARKRYANPRMKHRYIVRSGRPMPLPLSPPALLTSSFFSLKAKLRLLKEPFVKASEADKDESLAEFVERRFGKEVLDYAINPFVAGVYAGDPESLSVRHAFPKLHALEQRYGSVLKGQIQSRKEARRKGEMLKSQARLFSFDAGMQVLTDRLGERVASSIQLASPVAGVEQVAQQWRIHGPEVQTVDAVLAAMPTHAMAAIGFEAHKPIEMGWLKDVNHPPVASVVMGFERKQVPHPLDGFGMLVPKAEKRGILGTIFSSSLFDGRAPEGYVTLSTYVGGTRQPHNAGLDQGDMDRLILSDLEALLGVQGSPAFVHRKIWPQAIPQYSVGYGRVLDRFDAIESSCPGLFFAGHFRNGISLGDSMLAGLDVAERIHQHCQTT